MKTVSKFAFPLATFALACFVLSSEAHAACQQGCSDPGLANTFLGEDALINTTEGGNTAIGFQALLSNTTGFSNTATGVGALSSTTSGNSNTATGAAALGLNTTGGSNTATGRDCLSFNSTGNSNTATGYAALSFTRGGSGNTAMGASALLSNSSGSDNTAFGIGALNVKRSGDNNIALGAGAGTFLISGSNNMYIGSQGDAGNESNTIHIGEIGLHTTVYFAGIRTSALTTGDAIPVGIGSDGQLGVRVSSARYKQNIEPMAKSSEAILSLKPVTFRYKKNLDPKATPQFGLVAEDVAKVDPNLVARDEQGKPYTVRYEAVNAMLLNEFLKEHKKVETLEAKVAKLEATLEKVSARLETEQAAPRLVENR